MKTKKIIISAVTITIIGVIAFVIFNNKTLENSPLRLGWQPPWVNQGQIIEVFKHSDVLARNNVKIDYKPFSYGGPMTEAALAGNLDILFVGDQPAITLISRDPNWHIIARMVNYRSAIIVPPNSPYKSLIDLKGKKIATAFGSTTHRDLIRELLQANIDPAKDVQLVNLDQAEHASVISSISPDKGWNGVDAIATYDPTIALGVSKNQARILKEWTSPGVIIAKNDVLKSKPNEIVNFLKSYREAFAIYANSPSTYNKLYSSESRLEVSDDVFTQMSSMEPNMSKKDISEIDVTITAERKQLHQLNADIAYKIKIIKKSLVLKDYFDDTFLKQSMTSIKN
jgi:ABC-type nitrate/sulfonate/bicarbonate transport system substrate-binding protein